MRAPPLCRRTALRGSTPPAISSSKSAEPFRSRNMSRNDVDPFLLEVLKNGLDTIADEMALVTMKKAYSGIVRDSMDFSTAVCDAEGQTLAQGLTPAMHLASFYAAMRCLITTQHGNFPPDDFFI